MKDQWHDSIFTKEWDETTLKGNPSRKEQLGILISLLNNHCKSGDNILDIGIGSAQLQKEVFSKRDDICFVGVDYSDNMLNIAKKRLESLNIFSNQCYLIQHDLADIQSISLPKNNYSCVVSVQTLHHLNPAQQLKIHQFVYELLESNGIFLLLDRIEVDSKNMGNIYASMWDHLEQNAEEKSNLSSEKFLEQLSEKDDYPLKLEEQIEMLQNVGFTATCLHLNLNRGLFIGKKL